MEILQENQPPFSEQRKSNKTQADPKLPPGTKYCQCSVCGEYFSTERSFDAHRTGPHRTGDRRCETHAGMESKGLRLNSRGYWIRQVLAKQKRDIAA